MSSSTGGRPAAANSSDVMGLVVLITRATYSTIIQGKTKDDIHESKYAKQKL
jgi:hypothetical protein